VRNAHRLTKAQCAQVYLLDGSAAKNEPVRNAHPTNYFLTNYQLPDILHLNQKGYITNSSAPNTSLDKAKTPHKSASVAYRDAKINSVAPKKAPTVEKPTPKPPNHRNKCLAHRDTIQSVAALNLPKLAKIYFPNIHLRDWLPTKKLRRRGAVPKQSAAKLGGAGAAQERR